VPDVLGEAYKQVAARRAQQGDYTEALRSAERGLEVAPNSRSLQQARKDYKIEVNIARLEEVFRQQLDFDTARASRMVNEIRAWAPERYRRLEQQFIDLLAGRIQGLGETSREKARRLAARTTNVFPGSPRLARLREEMAPEPWPEGSAARAALSAGRLSEAQQILDRALADMPDHPEVQNFRKDLEQRKTEAQAAFEAYKQALEQDNLERAQNKLAEARSAWVDNQQFRQAQSELSAKLARERRQESQVLRRGSGVESLEASGAEVVDEEWQPIESTRACTRALAGHGTRARAVCFDLLHQRVRGPLMVVVPQRDGASPYAISKYEISNDDYNKYCFLSGECAVDEDAPEDQPKTGLTLEEIRAYVDWLSQRTGRTYRLPNERQWIHAARAGGDQPPRDYNCRVTLGGDILKGRDLVDVSVGQQNGWGLKNYVGNAQELVRTTNGLILRGGAYTDSHAQCSYELERSYEASAPETTGFRVVHEDIPKTE